MRKIIIPVFLLIIISACSQKQSDHNSALFEVKPNLNNKIPIINDSILSDFILLKLETPEGLFLGSIDKLIFSKNRIYIADVRMMNSVYIFDHYGDYVNHIEGGFKGPGEFIRPQSITTDFQSDKLFVFDDKLNKILIYNRDGEFISEIKFKNTANDISILNDKLFAFNSGFPQIGKKVNSYDLLYVSAIGRISEKFLQLKDWRKNSIFNKDNSFCEYMDTVWYSPVYNDTIYLLTENGPIPSFHINLGKKFVDDVLARKINLDDPNSEYLHSINKFQKAGNIIYYGFKMLDPQSGRNVIKHVFYDTKSGNSRSGQFLTGSKKSSGLFTSPISSTGEYFVGAEDAFQVKRNLEFNLSHGNQLSEDKLEVLESISEYDNPFLVFYRIDSL